MLYQVVRAHVVFVNRVPDVHFIEAPIELSDSDLPVIDVRVFLLLNSFVPSQKDICRLGSFLTVYGGVSGPVVVNWGTECCSFIG